MILVILAVVSATFQPARPTVGDRIVIQFPAAVCTITSGVSPVRAVATLQTSEMVPDPTTTTQPEPATAAVLALGASTLITRRRRS